ncbi:hypothetical protein THIOM_000360 [Candidatus Thiomargarita nelsonii]|uniref:Uncharacterized protein n=1 Tax=Candidatus Thiomargarita nelsonii TaxID=1003181 RepID=A0A176S7C4_9GAMM|nr:hypothetical protein THIOM_000360 [Candidatus Thiomargarita nelsonii]
MYFGVQSFSFGNIRPKLKLWTPKYTKIHSLVLKIKKTLFYIYDKRQMKKTKKPEKIEWHKLLGKLLKDLLSPVDIEVLTEAPVMSESPKIAKRFLLLKATAKMCSANLPA